MLLVTKQHHERDEEKMLDKEKVEDIGKVWSLVFNVYDM
jgi:hypothetical protein